MIYQKKTSLNKLVYATPVIQEYGNVRALTQNFGPNGAQDNGGGGKAGPKTA